MLRQVASFCRPLRPVLLLVLFTRSRSPVVGVPGLCWMWHGVPVARQWRPVVGVLRLTRKELKFLLRPAPPPPPRQLLHTEATAASISNAAWRWGRGWGASSARLVPFIPLQTHPGNLDFLLVPSRAGLLLVFPLSRSTIGDLETIARVDGEKQLTVLSLLNSPPPPHEDALPPPPAHLPGTPLPNHQNPQTEAPPPQGACTRSRAPKGDTHLGGPAISPWFVSNTLGQRIGFRSWRLRNGKGNQ